MKQFTYEQQWQHYLETPIPTYPSNLERGDERPFELVERATRLRERREHKRSSKVWWRSQRHSAE